MILTVLQVREHDVAARWLPSQLQCSKVRLVGKLLWVHERAHHGAEMSRDQFLQCFHKMRCNSHLSEAAWGFWVHCFGHQYHTGGLPQLWYHPQL